MTQARQIKMLEQRLKSLENNISRSDDPNRVLHSTSQTQGLASSLGDIRCVCDGKISVHSPVYVVGDADADGSDLSKAMEYSGSLELEFPRGVLGVAQQSGSTGDIVMVRFSGTSLVKKDTSLMRGGDVVWLNDDAYVENQPSEIEEQRSIHSAGVTHFQVLQDASVADTVVYIKFLTDISSRGVPVKIVEDPEDAEATETQRCDVYPFGPKSNVIIHKRIPIELINNSTATFEIDSWHIATIIGDTAYTVESSSASNLIYLVIDANYSGDPETGPIYQVVEVDSHTNSNIIVPVVEDYDPEDVLSAVVSKGYPFGLIIGHTYSSSKIVEGDESTIIYIEAPEMHLVRLDSGSYKLMDKHQGDVLKSGVTVEVLSNPTMTTSLFNGVYYHARYDIGAEALTIEVPAM